jgi:hypothetical protein
MDDNKNVLDDDLYYSVTDILKRSNVISCRFINKIKHPGLIIVYEYKDDSTYDNRRVRTANIHTQCYVYNILTKHKQELFNMRKSNGVKMSINNTIYDSKAIIQNFMISNLSHKTDMVVFDGIVIDGDNIYVSGSHNHFVLLYKISDSTIKLSYHHITDGIDSYKILCHGKYIVYHETKTGLTHIIDTSTSEKIDALNGTYSCITGHGRLIKVDISTPRSSFVYDLMEQTKICEGKAISEVTSTTDFLNVYDHNDVQRLVMLRKDDVPLDEQCSICFKRTKKNKVLVPCGHRQYCKTCITTIKKCALCRKDITQVIDIY